MSLSPEIAGAPREDRFPYLQLEAEADRQCVTVMEGHTWQGEHLSAGVTTRDYQLSDITGAFVTSEALAILRRSIE